MDISFDDLIPGKKVAPKDISFDDLIPRDIYANQAKQDSSGQNLLASIGGAMYGPYLKAKQTLGLASPEDVQQYKDSISGLWSTPMGKVGTVGGGAAVAAPFAMMAGPGALGAAAVGAGLGAAQPTGPNDSTLLNAAIGGGGGVVGKYAGDLIGRGASALFANKSANLATQQAANAVRDATTADAQAAGYVLPPTQVNPDNPGVVNRLAEGLAGKIQTGQAAAIKNQQVTDALAKQAVGLPQNVPLTQQALQGVRQNAGKVYEQVKNFGPVQADSQFANDIQGVIGPYQQLAQSFPSTKIASVEDLISDLSKPTFNSSDAVELVKRLRFDGFKNIGSPDPNAATLGKVQIGAQNAIEDLLDRNIGATDPTLLPAFRQARTTIAKTYSIEKALEDSTGKVVASKIGSQYASGKPLSGELQTIGKVAQAFPRAVQNVNSSMPGLSPLDYMGGILTGSAAGVPGLAATFARPLVRSAILSKPYQSLMAQPQNYNMGLLGSQLPKLDNATLKMLERLGSTSGALSVPWGNPQ